MVDLPPPPACAGVLSVKAPRLLEAVLVRFAGLVLLIFPRWPNRCNATLAADGDFIPSHSSDYAGLQANDLLDSLGGLGALS